MVIFIMIIKKKNCAFVLEVLNLIFFFLFEMVWI